MVPPPGTLPLPVTGSCRVCAPGSIRAAAMRTIVAAEHRDSALTQPHPVLIGDGAALGQSQSGCAQRRRPEVDSHRAQWVRIGHLGVQHAAVQITINKCPAARVDAGLDVIILVEYEIARRSQGLLTVLCSLPAVRGDGQHLVKASVPLAPLRDVRPNLDCIPGGAALYDLPATFISRMARGESLFGLGRVLDSIRPDGPAHADYDLVVCLQNNRWLSR